MCQVIFTQVFRVEQLNTKHELFNRLTRNMFYMSNGIWLSLERCEDTEVR
jgi:hypothetical protein